jgi:hypothetical protein
VCEPLFERPLWEIARRAAIPELYARERNSLDPRTSRRATVVAVCSCNSDESSDDAIAGDLETSPSASCGENCKFDASIPGSSYELNSSRRAFPASWSARHRREGGQFSKEGSGAGDTCEDVSCGGIQRRNCYVKSEIERRGARAKSAAPDTGLMKFYCVALRRNGLSKSARGNQHTINRRPIVPVVRNCRRAAICNSIGAIP